MTASFRVGQRVTWNQEGNSEMISWFRRYYGEIVTIQKIESDATPTNHPQVIWLSDNEKDRLSGWWFQPVSVCFALDAID